MTGYLTRDRAAIAGALVAPLAAALVLLPFRASWPNTNVALLLVVVVVAVAAIGNRVASALAAVGAAVWFDFFFTVPYERFTIRSAADVTTFMLLLVVGVAASQLAAYARRLKVIAITDAGYLAQIQEATGLTQSARPRMRSRSLSGSSWRSCWGWSRPGSSLGRCAAIRRGCRRTGP
jgi:K+-sensing histidine kinase KdpD